MSRQTRGAYLYLKRERRDSIGNVTHQATWIIRDRGRDHFTGCTKAEIAQAEAKLKDYIADKHTPVRRERDIEQIDVADVLSIYADDNLSKQVDNVQFFARLERLNEFWGNKKLADINGETCREYGNLRGSDGGARRDLEDLRAAVNHHSKEGLHRGIVRVTLPKKGKARDRWLERNEAAQLIWACWRTRESQTVHRGARKGQAIATAKRPLRHLARFILIGLYTGTRAAAIASASPIPGEGRSYVDLERGIFYRLAQGQKATNKRQPPVPLPPRLLAHMRRWKARGLIDQHFVEYNGAPVTSVKTAFNRAVKLAGLGGHVSPHTLRHTCATWLMQSGTDRWQVAGYLGMSIEMLDRVYGHHHPDYLQQAVAGVGRGSRIIGSKPEQRQILSGAVLGAVTKSGKAR